MSDKYQDFGKGAQGAELDQLCINTIKTLTLDAVQKAESGHPGLPMGCAVFAHTLWTKFLRHNPANPHWANRDRFVLSGGHGSMLIYSLLHLFGYPKMTLDEIKNFRQWGSLTPGHPEYGHTPGVEVTTGPLGQGFANGVGLALAEKFYAATFNTPDFKVIDHKIYGIVSDGDLQEGVAAEAASLAGHLGLDNIIYFYDSNHITIEGNTSLSYSDNVRLRFEGYHWNVIEIDGENPAQIESALSAALKCHDKPTLIIGKTVIGAGSPKYQGTQRAHSDAFGEEEVAATKKNIGWPEDAHFLVPQVVKDFYARKSAELAGLEKHWTENFNSYRAKHADKSALWEQFARKEIPADLASKLPVFDPAKAIATRAAGGEILKAIMLNVPFVLGGSADLHPSTKTFVKECGSVNKGEFSGRNYHFGIREHAMGAAINGIAYYGGGLIPFGSTFFVFSDYLRPTIRLAALSHIQSIFVFTHDSIFVGEDGPTHEPVEHLSSLRSIPNATVLRPADATETAVAWLIALERQHGPTVLVLSRQNLPVIDRSKYASADLVRKGAYVLADFGTPERILIATGSEVALALDAAQKLGNTRVVSMPSFDLFEAQPPEYREKVLPKKITKRLAIEAGSPFGWDRYIGAEGKTITVNRFGASAPQKKLAEEYGFTVENVLAVAKTL
ncbi:transketolase [Kamptonema cortianum]|nr:transketolase [Kamptonema cortianum]MDL5046216.1 transketolase [Oscillatoria amoena NRMC-F 0135]